MILGCDLSLPTRECQSRAFSQLLDTDEASSEEAPSRHTFLSLCRWIAKASLSHYVSMGISAMPAVPNTR